jgi:hypothetical protein
MFGVSSSSTSPAAEREKQHLPAVADRGEAGGAVEAHPEVAAVRELGLGGVDADPHPDLDALRPGLVAVAPLHRNRGGDRVLRPWERDEERLALCVDFVAAVFSDRIADELVMARQHAAVLGAELLEQPRGALDVGEEEGHGPRRKLPSCHVRNRGTGRVL